MLKAAMEGVGRVERAVSQKWGYSLVGAVAC